MYRHATRKPEELHKKAEHDFEGLYKSYISLLEKAKVATESDASSGIQDLQSDVHGANLLSAAESLFLIITELKTSALIHDEARLNEMNNQEIGVLQKERLSVRATVDGIADEIDMALEDIEDALYL